MSSYERRVRAAEDRVAAISKELSQALAVKKNLEFEFIALGKEKLTIESQLHLANEEQKMAEEKIAHDVQKISSFEIRVKDLEESNEQFDDELLEAQAKIKNAREKEYEGYTNEIDDLCAFIFKHVHNFDFDLIDEKLERKKGETVRKARMANEDHVA